MQQGSFNAYAVEYDSAFTNTLIGSLQRSLVHRTMKARLKPADAVLELNCGTGKDAEIFHGLVNSYHATDISAEMIKRCQEKYSGRKNLKFSVFDLKDHGMLVRDFNIVLSNFGGLNCIPPEALRVFFQNNSASPGTDYYLVIMGKNCVWEKVYFMLKRNFRKARRRNSGQHSDVVIKGETIRTWYYSPEEIREMSRSAFEFKTLVPIGFFLPPSYLDNKFRRLKFPGWLLYCADLITARLPFFADYADHYLIHLRKK
jgi:SAM-dependent methyltransferase